MKFLPAGVGRLQNVFCRYNILSVEIIACRNVGTLGGVCEKLVSRRLVICYLRYSRSNLDATIFN
jgi:hypothetical protein